MKKFRVVLTDYMYETIQPSTMCTTSMRILNLFPYS